jgi:hypothetical protein
MKVFVTSFLTTLSRQSTKTQLTLTIGMMVLILALVACQTEAPTPPLAEEEATVEAQASPVCGNAPGPTVISLSPTQIAVAQRPGRQFIGMVLTPGGRDGLLVIVDDAPGLPSTSVRVELDIDASRGVAKKLLEFWSACRTTLVSTIQPTMLGGFGVGVICSPLSATNNFRSGCTVPGTITLNRLDPRFPRITEFWFRKQCGWFGLTWCDAGVMDATFWQAFGGRSVRFIWFAD